MPKELDVDWIECTALTDKQLAEEPPMDGLELVHYIEDCIIWIEAHRLRGLYRTSKGDRAEILERLRLLEKEIARVKNLVLFEPPARPRAQPKAKPKKRKA